MYEVRPRDGAERDPTPPDRAPEDEFPYQTVKIADYAECSSENNRLGYDYNYHACARMCYEASGCEFFLHDPNDGECLQENTNRNDCGRDRLVESQYYMFYWNQPTRR